MIEIEKIIWNLLTNTNITDLVWNRIYWWSSPNESEDGIFICINTKSNVIPNKVQTNNRIEFRIFWKDYQEQFIDIKNVDNELFKHLTNENNFSDLWGFKFVPWNYIEWYWENKVKQWIRDFIYYGIL